MVDSFSDFTPLSIFLIILAITSLIFSGITLTVQLRRLFQKKQKRRTNEAKDMHQAPSAYVSPTNYGPHINEHAWNHVKNHSVDYTVPLFSSSANKNRHSAIHPADTSGQEDYTVRLTQNSYQLYIKESTPAGERSYDITVEDEIQVGRMCANGIQIMDSSVSRLQCTLIAGSDRLYIKNQSEINITCLNQKKVNEPCALNAGDVITFGHVQLHITDIRKYDTY